MQDTLRLMIYTIVAVMGIWFITMTISVHLFLHSDIDSSVTGFVPLNKTDIGEQCGPEYENSNRLIDYKLNSQNQIVYLCPSSIWPIRTTVVAGTLSEYFRNKLRPDQLAKINVVYPTAAEKPQQLINPAPLSNQAPPANSGMSNAGPTEMTPAPNTQPAMNGSLTDTTHPTTPTAASNAMTTPAAPNGNDNTTTAPAYIPPTQPAPTNSNPNATNPSTSPSSNSMMTPPPLTNSPPPIVNNNPNAAPAPANTMIQPQPNVVQTPKP